MAKSSMVQREYKRERLVARHSEKRSVLTAVVKSLTASEEEKYDAMVKLQKLPVNSSASRLRNRCRITGRPHGVYSKFGLCRIKLREHMMAGNIPGLKKASW